MDDAKREIYAASDAASVDEVPAAINGNGASPEEALAVAEAPLNPVDSSALTTFGPSPLIESGAAPEAATVESTTTGPEHGGFIGADGLTNGNGTAVTEPLPAPIPGRPK